MWEWEGCKHIITYNRYYSLIFLLIHSFKPSYDMVIMQMQWISTRYVSLLSRGSYYSNAYDVAEQSMHKDHYWHTTAPNSTRRSGFSSCTTNNQHSSNVLKKKVLVVLFHFYCRVCPFPLITFSCNGLPSSKAYKKE